MTIAGYPARAESPSNAPAWAAGKRRRPTRATSRRQRTHGTKAKAWSHDVCWAWPVKVPEKRYPSVTTNPAHGDAPRCLARPRNPSPPRPHTPSQYARNPRSVPPKRAPAPTVRGENAPYSGCAASGAPPSTKGFQRRSLPARAWSATSVNAGPKNELASQFGASSPIRSGAFARRNRTQSAARAMCQGCLGEGIPGSRTGR